MNTPIKAGLILAIAVTLVSAIMIASGMHEKNIMLYGLISLVLYIGLNVVILFWALSQTAADNGYGKQVLNCLIIGVVGGVVIMIGSWLLLAVVFPDTIAETRDATLVFLEGANLTEAQMDAQVAKLDSSTAMSQSVQGLLGTLGTSLVIGAIIAIFKRRK